MDTPSLILVFQNSLNSLLEGRMVTFHRAITSVHIVQPDEAPRAPMPMCFTKMALLALIDTLGSRPPETGAMGFSPKEYFGFEAIEFDAQGSEDSGPAYYRPDAAWCEERQRFHVNRPDKELRLWSGQPHTHPGAYGFLSGKDY